MSEALDTHLQSGSTSVCRCWKIVRKDGVARGFTDHDRDLTFDGTVFEASSGLSPSVLVRSTGLAVDNAEAVGVLASAGLTEADIASGIYDDAEVWSYLVNWADVAQRKTVFRGTIGEITRAGGEFRAELRGLADKLGEATGRAFLKPCGAVLGDAACKVDLEAPGYSVAAVVEAVDADGRVTLTTDGAFAEGWFERGYVRTDTGRRIGIKRDALVGGQRQVTFWHLPAVQLEADQNVTLVVGCDRRAETCRVKFNNISNFRGFPDLPGGDFVMQTPASGQIHDGGSRR